MIEKHLEHQQDLYHNFIDFKKAFDQVGHDCLWHLLRSFSSNKNLVQSIEELYANSSNDALLNNPIGGVLLDYGGSLLRMYTVTCPIQHLPREYHAGHPTGPPCFHLNGGRHICNLRFADDIDLLGGINQELQDFTDKLLARGGVYDM